MAFSFCKPAWCRDTAQGGVSPNALFSGDIPWLARLTVTTVFSTFAVTAT